MSLILRIPTRALPLLLLPLLFACDLGTTPEGPVRVRVDPDAALIVGIGETVSFTATVRDGSGSLMPDEPVTWSTGDEAIATVDATGTATGTGAGVTTVSAAAGDASGSASLEVYVPPVVDTYVPGETYSGRAGYIEYTPGDLPVVLSAGHGGDLEPEEIPDRTYGTTVTDLYTIELTRAAEAAIMARTGGRPHVIISNLDRVKLDPNREIEEAAQGSPFAELAWHEYHGYIDDASEIVERDSGAGLYLDMHGHGHEILRLELGYLLSGDELALPDSVLDAGGYAAGSSIADLADRVGIPFSELLRGPTSLGALLADRGVRAVPGDDEPGPGDDPYFSGGYSTRRHGSRDGGAISGIQIEHHRVGLRDTETNRAAYARILADALEVYFAEHYGVDIGAAAVVERADRS